MMHTANSEVVRLRALCQAALLALDNLIVNGRPRTSTSGELTDQQAYINWSVMYAQEQHARISAALGIELAADGGENFPAQPE